MWAAKHRGAVLPSKAVDLDTRTQGSAFNSNAVQPEKGSEVLNWWLTVGELETEERPCVVTAWIREVHLCSSEDASVEM